MSRIWDKSKPPTGPFTLNKDCAQAQGLVAWYPISGSTGRYVRDGHDNLPLVDESGNYPAIGGGEIPHLQFTAANSQYLACGKTVVSSYPISISTWFNSSALAQQVPLCLSNPDGILAYAMFDILPTGEVWAQIDGGNEGAAYAISSRLYSANQWTNAIAVFSSTASRDVYVNGGGKGSNTDGRTFPANTSIYLGRLNTLGAGALYFDGKIGETCVWNIALSETAIARINDPGLKYELWYPLRSKKWISLAGGVTGTLATTNANDTLAASGTTIITGTLATTNANDTLAASGTTTITGTLATTNANDTLGASGTTTITGTLTRTNANDTLAASGATTITGTLARANANDTLAASGSVGSDITGSVNYTNANDTLAASGTTSITGTLTRTNANDTLAASGTTTITGTLARTNANDTLAASGATTITGTLARTNADDTLAASGTSGSNISGTLATTNANDTLAASGTTTITGTLARTNANDTLVASGTTDIIGTLFRNNNNDTSTATGSTTIIGAIARTNANDTVIASGFVGVQPVDFIDWVLYARPGNQVLFNRKMR